MRMDPFCVLIDGHGISTDVIGANNDLIACPVVTIRKGDAQLTRMRLERAILVSYSRMHK